MVNIDVEIMVVDICVGVNHTQQRRSVTEGPPSAWRAVLQTALQAEGERNESLKTLLCP